MTRIRTPKDRERDLREAGPLEAKVAEALRADPRTSETLIVRTDSTDQLDFSFEWNGERVEVDLKTKRQPTGSKLSADNQLLATDIPDDDLFPIDETTFRRIVWHGGGGYLLAHHMPRGKWYTFGPWELTLSPKHRYDRLNTTTNDELFYKGKMFLDVRNAYRESDELSIDDLVATVDNSRYWARKSFKTLGCYPLKNIDVLKSDHS